MKIQLLLICLALTISCSVKTNEEKARDLIEPDIKASLIKPDSYEFSQIKLDSCFSDNPRQNSDVIDFSLKVAKLFKKYKEYMSEAERAESTMTIYASSFGYQDAHSRQQEKKYKAEMEKAQRKAATIKDEIIRLYKDNKKMFERISLGKHEFIGWYSVFSYRAETAGGLKTMDTYLFYLNKELTEITYRFTEEDFDLLESAGFEDLQYEFEELKDYF